MNDFSELPPDGMDLPRFSGIATFMRLPHVTDFTGYDIGIIGVPWDAGVTNRPGTRHGPRQLRDMSSLIRRYNGATWIAPFDDCRIADFGDVKVNPVDLDMTMQRVTDYMASVREAGVMPMVAGGDHMISLPVLRGLVADTGPVGMVHFDAHMDVNDSYFGGSKLTHGTPFRRAIEEGLLNPKRIVQVGIRGSRYDRSDEEYAQEVGIRVITIEEYFDLGIQEVIKEIHRVVGDQRTYVTFDIDALDPCYAPGTGTPEIGGYTPFDAQVMIRSLGDLNLIGADLVEVSPPFDQSGGTAIVGVNLMFELICVLSQARCRQRK
ncbi:agmatinase [Kiloniella litopenaei]|uniref:Agmatinase n=1 Tax=Kiloniella litopenaei TaxID=1549748 RepID=A0A0M2R950_9PROT|nr:agmatinase [Kiloniella litopenaei]KKJ76984.1 agmatinase [Kiloniella litopenaei]